MATADTDLLTTDEVIECLLRNAQLARMASTCVLPAVRVGNEWRFRKSDLDAWIRRHQQHTPKPTIMP